ncbi:MAG: type II secretion system F family protein [Lachnospiraceae bacterium]|nr:type II secretion system F family protein [Lachnospiraceae bacterium]
MPDQINGEVVKWEEARENSAGTVWITACITAILIYCMKDYDLHKQVLLKQEDMFNCYPEIVNRLVLYVGAGMTVRNAWRKIATDHTKNQSGKKGHIYQEMLFACYEMDSGTSESEAYERFGRRCGIQQYIKLSTLLVQNMQKGNSTMLMQLKEEAENAFSQRMDRARKKGEEAGTKLLMPMMILFGMVMILIMIPAFGTFGM